jgi:DNA-binding Lrp family transcriptional regulator
MNALERRLLNDYQRGFPLTATPFADIATELGASEQKVIETLRALSENGSVSRVGAVFRPHRIGASTLAAMAIPSSRLDEVAELVSSYPQVNHNYEREHHHNLWFVVTGADETEIDGVLRDIERRSGAPVLRLSMLDDYHIDLGFVLRWDETDETVEL